MPPAVKRPALCIFDLDGTLVDSLRDIAEALNECLGLLGLPAHPIDRYRHMVGEGIPKLCERAAGASHPHLVNRLIELARPRYRTRPLRHSRPYPGVVEMIERLRRVGLKLAVLSNKPHDMTVSMIQALWADGIFERVRGYLEELPRKPDPHCVLEICRELGVRTAETCLVGDTPTDIEAARRAGVIGIGITWGFRNRADLSEAGATYIVDTPGELVGLLGRGE